ncbi:MAG: hypothetical protein KDC87_08955 [Planctomycetes bacterium]|nr:hypothetical protein [Planctomycetota bacterium]MCB9868810.1 hypothetical protein [Planctomycetota bacterium]
MILSRTPNPTILALCLALAPLTAQSLPDPARLDFRDGTDRIPDRATFEKLSYQGPEVMIDVGVAGVEFVKYQIEGLDTDRPQLYFINTVTHRAHMMFAQAIGLGGPGRPGGPGRRGGFGRGMPPGGAVGQMRGILAFRPLLVSKSGAAGMYTIEYEPEDDFPFRMVKRSVDMLVDKAPFLRGRIAYYPIGRRAEARWRKEKELYDAAGIPAFFPDDAYKNIAYLPLNVAKGVGRLRLMKPGEHPGVRDIVIYPTLPNEMPRVAGVLTEMRQTPLSHVNLRAVQDGIPNAFLRAASTNPQIRPLLGSYVVFEVRRDGFAIRAAQQDEVEKHFAALRPRRPQVPERDLAVRTIRSLDQLDFADAKSVGAKAANLAVLRKLGFAEGTVPEGFAVPFAFYDAFMHHNQLYARVKQMREQLGFAQDAELRRKALAKLRKRIQKCEVPAWMEEALEAMRRRFPAGTRIRCRSSTNNEDLPRFSGAGLYDSFTHRPDEGPLSKSIKQVFASTWTFRAYEEREFHRIDHFATAMGVLCHPSYSKERANGVAIGADPVYQSGHNYYVNAQAGHDLVTNPSAEATPEELLLDPTGPRGDKLVRSSSLIASGAHVLSRAHRDELRRALGRINRKFRRCYKRSRSAGAFAMEVEFKVTHAGRLVIKQARPWLF